MAKFTRKAAIHQFSDMLLHQRLLPMLAAPLREPPLALPARPVITTHRLITYIYDSLYRLAGATYSTGEYYPYTYDAVGNRLSLTWLGVWQTMGT